MFFVGLVGFDGVMVTHSSLGFSALTPWLQDYPDKPPWWRCEEGEDGRAKYHFLTKAFEPKYFWFELVEYARKLFLLGILLFADQGSISQVRFGIERWQ